MNVCKPNEMTKKEAIMQTINRSEDLSRYDYGTKETKYKTRKLANEINSHTNWE